MKIRFFAMSSLCFLLVLSLNSCGPHMGKKLPVSAKDSALGYSEVNADNPGLELDVKKSIVYGKYTIIDFTSPGCGACMEMQPFLEQLHESRPDIVVRSFDVNREGAEGIDWDSPLAQKYEIHSLPFFKIFNEKGLLIAEGKSAKNMIVEILQENLNKRAHD